MNPGTVRCVKGGFVDGPVHAIGDVQRLTRLRQFFRAPERNDIVVGFVGSRNLYQIDGTLAPIAFWFDPGTWALVVAVVEVFIVAEVAATLQQAETTRVFDRVVAHGQVFWIVQWTPDPFAVAGMNRQTAGIVQLTTVVQHFRRLVGAEQEHAGQRRNAKLGDLVTQEHAGLDVDNGVAARTQGQTISTGGAWRIQQREDHQVFVTRFWPLNPEFGEAREFFAGR